MEISYIYPDSTSLFYRGVFYQIKDPITKEWSETKITTHACGTFIEMVRGLMKRNGIRIVKHDNTD
jgi:hypothetical protein